MYVLRLKYLNLLSYYYTERTSGLKIVAQIIFGADFLEIMRLSYVRT